VWLGMTACVIKGGERGLHADQTDANGRAEDAFLAHILSKFASGRTLRTFYV
jgi:hypothetical protein